MLTFNTRLKGADGLRISHALNLILLEKSSSHSSSLILIKLRIINRRWSSFRFLSFDPYDTVSTVIPSLSPSLLCTFLLRSTARLEQSAFSDKHLFNRCRIDIDINLLCKERVLDFKVLPASFFCEESECKIPRFVAYIAQK